MKKVLTDKSCHQPQARSQPGKRYIIGDAVVPGLGRPGDRQPVTSTFVLGARYPGLTAFQAP